jgi:predicted nucleic acid-binding protein
LIHYLDSSALVKRYVAEQGTEEVLALFTSDSPPVCSRIAHVEASAAFARRAHEGMLTPRQRDKLLERLTQDLAECRILEVTADIVRSSVTLVRQQPLRAYDAIQLASALWAGKHIDPRVRFVSADRSLARVARVVGLEDVVPGA